MTDTAFATFAQAATWESEPEPGRRGRNAARWAAARDLLGSGAVRRLSDDRRAQLHTYLIALVESPDTKLEHRLDALDLGLDAGLFSRAAAHRHLSLLLREPASLRCSSPQIAALANWLSARDLLTEPLAHEAIAASLLALDQDDRKRLLRRLADMPGRDAPHLATCVVVACERLVRLARTAALPPDAIDESCQAAESEGEIATAPAEAAPESSSAARTTKALADLRQVALPELLAPWIGGDAELARRLVTVAFDIWVPRAAPSAQVAVRAVADERRALATTIVASVATIPGWAYLAIAFRQPGREDGSLLTVLEGCWQAGAVDLYGQLVRDLLLARPALVEHLWPRNAPAPDNARRIIATLAGSDGSLPAALWTEVVARALAVARDASLLEPSTAARLLQAIGPYARDLTGQAADGTWDAEGEQRALLLGIYGRYLQQLADTQHADPGDLTVDRTFLPALEEWGAGRAAEALAEVRTAREERDALRTQIDEAREEMARTQRALADLRSLQRSEGSNATLQARLPVLKQLMALADDVDRALVADQGDADTLAWARDAILDMLAAFDVQAVGAIGERTRFDPALHEYLGEKGVEQEWLEVFESGYVLMVGDETTVLKRIPVRPLTT